MDAYGLVRDARQRIKTADHLLTQTYPLVKDPKLLLAVLDNIYMSLKSAVSALLAYEREHKRIPPYHDSFESKFDIFKLKLARDCGFGESDVMLVHTIRDIKRTHQKSSVEFPRKDKFVMCTEDYRMETISADQLRKQIERASVFVGKVEHHIRTK